MRFRYSYIPPDPLPLPLLALLNQVALNGIERMFIKALSEDYAKWARDKSYRDQRAALSINDRSP